MTTEKQINDIIRKVMHPEIQRSLVELKMIKNVSVEGDKVMLTLVLPYKNIPIKDDLMAKIKNAVADLDSNLKVDISLAEMNQQERTVFMTAAEGGPKPAESINQIANIIAVLSGKGGVGKSSIAALLAVSLHRQGNRVGVLDADITGPSIPKMFGLHGVPKVGSVGIIPVETEAGIKIISINLMLPSEDKAVVWRGPLISKTIKQFWKEVLWGNLDYLIVDLPPGTSDASLTVMQSIPLSGVVLVTSPQDLAGMIVRKAAGMARQMGVSIIGVVENMSYVICPECGKRIDVFGPSQTSHSVSQLGLPLLGQLLLDPILALQCDAGQIESYPAELFTPISEKIIEKIS